MSVFAVVIAGCASTATNPQLRTSNYLGEKVEFASVVTSTERKTTWGYLSLPKAVAKPVAAMVLVHGSGGLGGREARYVAEYNKLGIATFVLAPFEAREVKKTTEDQSLVTAAEMNSDAIGALLTLLADQRIDPKRIGIQGGSKGGNVALSMVFNASYQGRKLPDTVRYTLHIPIYPGCTAQERNPVTTGTPILMLLGEKDDYTDPRRCQEYAALIKQRGANLDAITYTNAHHDFDGVDSLRLQWLPTVQNASACRAVIDDDGSVTDGRTGYKWKNQVAYVRDYLQLPCVKRGAHVGSDPVAKKKSLEDITAFLKVHRFVR